MKLILKIVLCLCLMVASADARMGVVGMGAGVTAGKRRVQQAMILTLSQLPLEMVAHE